LKQKRRLLLNLICFDRSIKVPTEKGVDIVDITFQLEEAVKDSGIKTGSLHATSFGSTGSLTTIEFEPGVVKDLAKSINEFAPLGRNYEHERAWADGNGHSHVQAALLGPSVVVPVRKGRCCLGTWQQVVVINHDIKPRTRKIELTIIGF
jgi:secondary thiamine-phosphate synthase enzyme